MLICHDQRSGAGCGAQHQDGTTTCATCGMSLMFAVRLHNVGAVVGSYQILSVIGFGGFGAVYLAEDGNRSRLQVALKETFDPLSIRSFHGEFAVLNKLSHAHLPAYHNIFEHQGNGYLVMEYVPGQSLEEILDKHRRPLLETVVLGYALQLCDALEYLHQQHPPIFHRDIKPANIRLTPEGVIKLVDFGLVKQGTGTTRSSRLGLTPAYAPIEQYGGRGTITDARSDIYSLGATIYHLLTNQEPLTATDRIAQSPDPLPSPRSIQVSLAPHMNDSIMRAMALQQKDRFQDAQSFKGALLGSGSLVPIAVTVPVVSSATQIVCKSCGGANQAGELYCQQCAFQLQPDQTCSRCGKSSPAGASYCTRCGYKV